MHPVIELFHSSQELHPFAHTCSPPFPGVENSYLDLGMLRQYGNALLAAGQQEVIHQYSDPDTAIGCIQESKEEQPAALVPMPDEVLGIDGVFGMVCKCQPPLQRLFILVQSQKT